MPKICDFETCRKYANYGAHHSKPTRCKEHKGEYQLVSKICIEVGCKIRPTYNLEGESKALYCVSHKLDGMVDIKHKTCIYSGCKIQPAYNLEGEAKALYCVSHKLDGMVNIVSKTCIYSGCKIQPTYNLEGEAKALYCVSHKLDGMVDIKNKQCIYPNCKTRSNYNLEGETIGIYCGAHKLDGMVDIKNKKCKANYCLGSQANVKYKGYCASCYQQLFPNDPLTLQSRSKTKEIATKNFINLNFEGFHHDISLWTGNCDCTHRRRIDHRKLIGNTLLCIETDENQHKGYDKDKEEIRYDDLFMLHGGKFIFIRFNPDKFKNKEGKSSNPMLYTRLPILKDEIEKQIKRIENDENKKLLEIEKLYYDE